MESTCHYWFNLADWLLEQSVEVVLVNPLTTKRNKENRDNCQSKSDAKDALSSQMLCLEAIIPNSEPRMPFTNGFVKR